jgi:hypothetical protein
MDSDMCTDSALGVELVVFIIVVGAVKDDDAYAKDICSISERKNKQVKADIVINK